MLQVLPAMVDELRVHDDLVDLAMGAIMTHVGLLEHVVKLGVRVHFRPWKGEGSDAN